MSAPIVSLTGVSHRYGTRTALEEIDLVMGVGSTAVLGPNGSGKTTLLRLVATVTEPQTGSVRIGGLDPRETADRIAVRRQLGYQTQTGALPARMRVDAFCDYVGALKEIGDARQRRRWTHWALARLGLGDVARDRIRSLSGGMQRRLALAQSLLGLPSLLVLDEPLTSLDAEQRTNVVTVVTEHSRQATVVVATHHADELAGACDRIVVLNTGRVVFADSPAALASLARGRVWEATEPHPSATCRSVGAGRYRCVAEQPPRGVEVVDPTVQDGYVVSVSRAGSDRAPGSS